MKCRQILTAALAAAALTVASGVAHGDISIGIGIGVPGHGAPYPGPYYAPDPYYPPPAYVAPGYRGRYISCARARQIVRNNGFRRVRAIDCRGKKYNFIAWRRGVRYAITIRSRNGRIELIQVQ